VSQPIITDHPSGAVLNVIAQPRSSRSEVAGVHDGAVRLRITAPPVDGAANAAILDLLSRAIGVHKGDVEIVSGATGRRKRVLIRGMSPQQVFERLQIG
jgi:uncharacterized protein